MIYSIFSLSPRIANLVVTDWGFFPNSPKGYLRTDGGMVITWHFLVNQLENLKTNDISIREFFSSFRTWTIILCHGGRLAAGLFEENQSRTHKTLSRYVTRKKQGMRQSKRNAKGKKSISPGAKFRSEQERKFIQDVMQWLKQHETFIKACDVIAYHAPGRNRNLILFDENLGKRKGQILVSLPFTTHAVTFEEVQRSYHVLTRIEFMERD